MPLRNGSPARNDLYQNLQYIRKRFQFSDGAQTIKVGTLPAGAIILPPISGIDVNTVFNYGTNNRVNLGILGTLAKYGANLSLTSLGFVPMAVAIGHHLDVDTDIYAQLDVTGTAGTTGDARVLIAYATSN